MFQNYAILFLIIVSVLFFIYLIRIVKLGYQNNFVNTVFVLSIIGIIISFDQLVSIVAVFATVSVKEESIYSFKPTEINRFFGYFSYGLKGIQVLFLGILIVVSFKVGKAKKLIPNTHYLIN